MPPELSQLAGIALAIMGAFWITLWATRLFVYLGWRNWGGRALRTSASRFVPWLTKS